MILLSDTGKLSKAVKQLVRELGDRVVAVSLFGSQARGEVTSRSDYDFFVVVKDLKEGNRRFKIYDPLYKVLKRDVTVIDMDEDSLFREDLTINSLLLNIAWDSIVLYDPEGKLRNLFKRIKNAVEKSGLKRYRTKNGKYGWKPVKGKLKTIEV